MVCCWAKRQQKMECQSSGDLMILPSVAVSKTSFHTQHWVTNNSLVQVALLDNWLAGQNPPMLPFVNSFLSSQPTCGIRTTSQEITVRGKWPKSLLRPQEGVSETLESCPSCSKLNKYLPLKKIKAGGKKRGHHTNQQETI